VARRVIPRYVRGRRSVMETWLAVAGRLLAVDDAPPLATVVCFSVALIALVTVGFITSARRHS
jgi:hypothetical protein